MVCLLQSLGQFFASSLKIKRLLQKAIKEKVVQFTFKDEKKILTETWWVERHTAFQDLDVLYLYIILCLEIISKNEDRNWDPKSVVEGRGLLYQLMESKFFVAFQVCLYLLGSLNQFLYYSNVHILKYAAHMKWLFRLHFKIFEIILTMNLITFTQRQIAWQKGLAKLHLLNPARLVERS